MVISLKKHYATEKRTVQWCREQYSPRTAHIKKVLKRIKDHFSLLDGAKILEIGAAQGLSVIVMRQLGYDCFGLEPSESALETSKALSSEFDIAIPMRHGYAECIPFENSAFDLIIADSVIEHVSDVEKVFSEVYRVLKPNGAFYFLTASSICPKQDEIRFFPFFSWYPQVMKVRIMKWASAKKPELIGFTDAPAINWFSPNKARRLLSRAGFTEVYGTWSVVKEEEVGRGKYIIRFVKRYAVTCFILDLFLPACIYLAIKK